MKYANVGSLKSLFLCVEDFLKFKYFSFALFPLQGFIVFVVNGKMCILNSKMSYNKYKHIFLDNLCFIFEDIKHIYINIHNIFMFININNNDLDHDEY